MITTVALASISITSCNYNFFVMRTFRISFLSNLEVYNTELLTIITMLCLRSPKLLHLLTASFSPLTHVFPISQPPSPW